MRLCYCTGTCKGICTYNLVYIQLIQLLPLKNLVFAVHFLNTFWHGNETFPKGSSQNEIVPLLVFFHLPYSKYKGVKIFLSVPLSKSEFFIRAALVSFVQYSCRTRVALVSHLCHTRIARVSLVSHSCRQFCTRVTFVSLVSHSCRTCLALVL